MKTNDGEVVSDSQRASSRCPKKGITVKVQHSASCGSAFTGSSDILVKNKFTEA